MSGEPHVRIDRGRLAELTPMARQKEHPVGKPVGLSLPDLPVLAEPAAYLTNRYNASLPGNATWNPPSGNFIQSLDRPKRELSMT